MDNKNINGDQSDNPNPTQTPIETSRVDNTTVKSSLVNNAPTINQISSSGSTPSKRKKTKVVVFALLALIVLLGIGLALSLSLMSPESESAANSYLSKKYNINKDEIRTVSYKKGYESVGLDVDSSVDTYASFKYRGALIHLDYNHGGRGNTVHEWHDDFQFMKIWNDTKELIKSKVDKTAIIIPRCISPTMNGKYSKAKINAIIPMIFNCGFNIYIPANEGNKDQILNTILYKNDYNISKLFNNLEISDNELGLNDIWSGKKYITIFDENQSIDKSDGWLSYLYDDWGNEEVYINTLDKALETIDDSKIYYTITYGFDCRVGPTVTFSREGIRLYDSFPPRSCSSEN